VHWHDYRSRRNLPLAALERVLERGLASELLAIACEHEGQDQGFDVQLVDALSDLNDWNMPILALGGISQVEQMRALLARPVVTAVGVGNFLSYRELAIQQFKQALACDDLRPALYASYYPHRAS
jgi:cyclase